MLMACDSTRAVLMAIRIVGWKKNNFFFWQFGKWEEQKVGKWGDEAMIGGASQD